MQRVVEYALFFVAVVLLQVFFFNNIDLSVYVRPIVYIAFIALLPLDISAVALLLLGLMTGAVVDLMTGTAGLNTIATLLVACVRPALANLTLGKDEVKDGGIPSLRRLGAGGYFRYMGALVLLQCLVLFTFESLSWSYFQYTLLRIVLSAAVSVIFIWLVQMLMPGGGSKVRQSAK